MEQIPDDHAINATTPTGMDSKGLLIIPAVTAIVMPDVSQGRMA